MRTILDTVVEYEDKVVELVRQARGPVVGYVSKAVEVAEARLPDVEYPAQLPTPIEVLDSQVSFAKKLIDAQADLAKGVLEAVAPLAGYRTSAPRAAKKAAKATAAA